MSHASVARQPIFNRELEVIGYELLFREPATIHADVSDHENATTRVVLNTLTEIGLEQLVGTTFAWINVTREFLLSGLVTMLPPTRVGLEILEDQRVDETLVEAVVALREQGYRFALDDFRLGTGADELIDHAEVVKLDLIALGRAGLTEHVRALRGHDVELLVEKVESHEEHAFARGLGCERFQGFFYRRPELLSRRRIDAGRTSLMRLLVTLLEPDVSLEQITREVAHDVGLSVRLLRYINSAYVGLSNEISSIGQAVTLLGPVNLRRWATLSAFMGLDRKGAELTRTALVRARFCELSGGGQDADAPQRFTLGLFSVIDALTDTPLRDALRPVPFPEEMRAALVHHTGPMGDLLGAVVALEEGAFAAAESLSPACGDVYLEALAWADGVMASLDEHEAPVTA